MFCTFFHQFFRFFGEPMRTPAVLMLTLILNTATGCLTPVEHDCSFASVAVDFYEPSAESCPAAEHALSVAHDVIARHVPSARFPKMFLVYVGYPTDHSLHQNQYQASCDLDLINLERVEAAGLTHEVLHLADNCAGVRRSDGTIDFHPDWDTTGRTDAINEARTHDAPEVKP